MQDPKYIELSHPIRNGMKTYQGLPKPIICDYFSREETQSHYEDGSSFQIGRIDMVGNTGTYMDCPFHRFADGSDFTQIELEDLVNIPGVCIDVPYEKYPSIEKFHFVDKDVSGKAILLCTGWSNLWGEDAYFFDHPFLSEDAAQYLVQQEAKIVGIDSYNIDDTSVPTRPVHTELLRNSILIIEHMTNLAGLSGRQFTFTATPPIIEGMGSFPGEGLCHIIGLNTYTVRCSLFNLRNFKTPGMLTG